MLLLKPCHPAALDTPLQWDWVQWRITEAEARQGQACSADLPADEDVMLVLAADQLSWHQVTLPKVPWSRLRATLEGLLEDRVLDDPSQLHFALEPGVRPDRGQVSTWVAVCQKSGLQTLLLDLQAHQRNPGRIVPAFQPRPVPAYVAHTSVQGPRITAMGPGGVLQLEASTWTPGMREWLARTHPGMPVSSCWADPTAIGWAESVLPEWPWQAISPIEFARQQAESDWNLAQLDFRPSLGRWRQRALWRAGQALARDRAWRPARWGLATLLLLQLAGLNVMAWQEGRQWQARQNEVRSLLTRTFPDVRLVLDAPLQMQQEMDRLRQSLGEAGPGSLEYLLQTLADAEPAGPLNLQEIRYRPGEASLAGWTPAPEQEAALKARLQSAGWQVERQGAQWQLRRGTTR